MDWDEFEPIEGLNQLVGHTRGKTVRQKKAMFSENWCADTHLNHFLQIDDEGQVIVHEIKDL